MYTFLGFLFDHRFSDISVDAHKHTHSTPTLYHSNVFHRAMMDAVRLNYANERS